LNITHNKTEKVYNTVTSRDARRTT